MYHPGDRGFLERRYRQELERTARAASPRSASIHREMAARYAEALARLDAAEDVERRTLSSAGAA